MRKQISFRQEDKDVYDYLGTLPNASQYIIRLVRKDMQGQKGITRQEVRAIVEEYLEEVRGESVEVKTALRKFLDLGG